MKSTDFATSMRPWCSTVPVHLTSRHPRRLLTDCLPRAILDPVWWKKSHYFSTTPKYQTGCIGTLQGQVNTTTALVYESDYYAFVIYHHASYSFHLSSPHRPNINQEDPCLLGLCLDDTNPWPDTFLPALPPLLQPRCTFQSSPWILGTLLIFEC